ncbi:MAG: polyribonucleotide nucleotidyltransferase [Candidatus Berkelbacteria bacterium Licking1014_85]|uniref:Polyribonucleotide nucleotidyltransferase n=1 Tax=Candidatus Berkelbacteria bacterium Licking1014_85 TaxID=2017148 RepID=A0A554LLF1_9BACT|nr:MAG: polyribonucleotide nucleotidyltransferase [Candidatus Berkelbacteria bacterium Licking1014_85]
MKLNKTENTETKILYADAELILKTGELANLANGAVVGSWGETVVLATVSVSPEARDDIDFLPLQVEYEERLYAAGKISGSRFIKREGRPSEKAVLTARQIDRPIRPLFPKNFRNDIQVIITVLSFDGVHDTTTVSTIAASAALLQSGVPFEGPIACAKVGKIDGKLVANPNENEMSKSAFEVVVSGTADKIMMLEFAGNEISESETFEAIKLGHNELKKALDFQTQLKKNNYAFAVTQQLEALDADIQKFLGDKLKNIAQETDESKKEALLNEFEAAVFNEFEGAYKQADLKNAFSKFMAKSIRRAILEDGKRPDGRSIDEIRPIDIKVGILPRTHGSGLFTRGQTQSLSIVTLGAPEDEQTIETMEEEGTKRYMHHYNFPPFSTGEVRPVRGAGRREIGHGALAEKALFPVLPSKEDFPYTIRVVSEILSSNGSSSMAATCGSTIALMDAGVKITKPVAGIAIGLVTPDDFDENPSDKFVILTDIAGIEDAGGDMDFKVAGTADGITAIQMDTKLKGLTNEIIEQALEAAKKARFQILDKITAVIPAPAKELSPYAPRIEKVIINPKKIGELIGPGGKTIRKIVEDCGGKEVISIDIEDTGLVMITSNDPKMSQRAIDTIEGMTQEVEMGKIYEVTIEEIIKDRNTGKEIGAIASILPGKSGMIHISEIANERIADVSSRLKKGAKVKVKVVSVDEERGRIGLSIKKALDNITA